MTDLGYYIQTYYKYFIFLLLIISTPAFSDEGPISLSSNELNQGGVILINIRKTNADTPEVKWINKTVSLLYRPEKKVYAGFITTDLQQKPGTYSLTVLFKPSGIEKHSKIKILAKDYGVRKLTLPDGQVNLSAKDIARTNREKEIIDRIWEQPVTLPCFKASFIMPLETEIIGPFGRRSIINDQPRSPHTGIDLRGKKGTPVKASNDGVVVFTGDHFFTGNSVIIDHGAGIFSMYFHLDKINVNKGAGISRGEIIGTVGSTGRSTAPHLHWGVRVGEKRVDPVTLVKVSTRLED